jgi:uncharacterized membrane protein
LPTDAGSFRPAGLSAPIMILQAGVQPGVIDAAGYAVGIGGILLTVAWLYTLFR